MIKSAEEMAGDLANQLEDAEVGSNYWMGCVSSMFRRTIRDARTEERERIVQAVVDRADELGWEHITEELAAIIRGQEVQP